MCKRYIKVAAPLQYESVADGEGLRIVLWTQGCRLKCPGCHNPQTHDENGGYELYIDDIKLALDANYKKHRGLTFSGGDPFLQPHECKEVALYAKDGGLELIKALIDQAATRQIEHLVLEADPCQHNTIIKYAKDKYNLLEIRGFILSMHLASH